MLRITTIGKKNLGQEEKKISRISIFIIASAVAMALRILGLTFYLTLAGNSRGVYFFTWWVMYFSSWTISFTKIMAFEPPQSASPSFGKNFGTYFQRPTDIARHFIDRVFGFTTTVESDIVTMESTNHDSRTDDSRV